MAKLLLLLTMLSVSVQAPGRPKYVKVDRIVLNDVLKDGETRFKQVVVYRWQGGKFRVAQWTKFNPGDFVAHHGRYVYVTVFKHDQTVVFFSSSYREFRGNDIELVDRRQYNIYDRIPYHEVSGL